MGNAVFVVFKSTISDAGIVVFAICHNRKAAEMARNNVARFKRGKKFYDLNPDETPYAAEVRISKVQVDVLYREGLDEAKLLDFVNLNELEVIS